MQAGFADNGETELANPVSDVSLLPRRMTIDEEINPLKRFAPAILPWLIAAAALAFYLMTLNHWVSFANLNATVRLSGWAWQPERSGPLYWLATLPFRWLPLKSIPLALNLFSAACGVLTLALLARSIALLPHDRTHEQRIREPGAYSLLTMRSAWIPPVLAAIVCGLQLTFWEGATAGSPEMLDILVFAYVIRCVLEYRIAERQHWLSRAALIYGIGMTNNWAMIAFLPVFLIALGWVKGVGFFNSGFLTRMFLWGLAGLSLFVLLPVVQSAADVGNVPFWRGLGYNLRIDKLILTSLFSKQALFLAPQPLWIMALFSLLPLLVMGIFWPSFFGDPSRLGVTVATLILHCFHAVLLVVCIWLALDPLFSPRNNSSYGGSGLTVYYLASLGIGYFTGYFLLVFGAKPKRPQPAPPFMSLVNGLAVLAIWLLLALTPAMLIYRNLSQIRLTNGPQLENYAREMLQDLPRSGAVVLSDNFTRLALARSESAQLGLNTNFLFLDTASLPAPDYHRFLKQQHPDRWPLTFDKNEKRRISDPSLMGLLYNLAKSNNICYLHPSFGYYFEIFYPEPHGVVYKLNLLPTNGVVTVLPDEKLPATNNAFWDKITDPQLKPLVAAVEPPSLAPQTGLFERLARLAHLHKEPNLTALTLGAFYARSLDFLGVQEQRSGALTNAARHFALALELNPENVAARANLACNTSLMQSGKTPFSASIEDKLGNYRGLQGLQAVLNADGPFDDPGVCYNQAVVFARGGLYQQSAREFARVKELAPEYLPTRLFLAQLDLLRRMPDRALQEVSEIHAQPALFNLNLTNQIELLSIEASAYLAQKDLNDAERAVRACLEKFPEDMNLLTVAARAYMTYGYYTNALVLLDRQIKLAPENLPALINKGYACLQIKAYDQAIPPLSRALELEPTNSIALLNRAIASLGADKLDVAQHDYDILHTNFPKAFPIKVNYGLGEIAYRKKDMKNAIAYYQLYLNATPTNNPATQMEIESVRARLKELRSNAP